MSKQNNSVRGLFADLITDSLIINSHLRFLLIKNKWDYGMST